LRASGASYAKYHLIYNDAGEEFSNQYDASSTNSREYVHSFPQQDLARTLKALNGRELKIDLKKKKLIVYKTVLDS